MGKLDGRVAIVTGAGRGIGRATAELFAREGAKVVVATRSPGPGEDAVGAIGAVGAEAELVTLDIGERDAVTELVRQSVTRFGRLDIVLHNAAHMPVGLLGEPDEKELDKTIDVALKAAFRLARDALPYLKASPAGRLLFTSSIAGTHKSFPGFVHHGVVKVGLNGFIRGRPWNSRGLGSPSTGSSRPEYAPSYLDDVPEDAIARMAADIPVPRLGDPAEIAHGFLYLASDEASYVTGQTIVIDGGATLGAAKKLPTD